MSSPRSTTRQWYAELLTIEARIPQALAEVNRAVALDPQSAVIHHQAGQVLSAARQYPQAIADYEKSLELDPNLFVNYFAMYLAYRRMGDYAQGIPTASYMRSRSALFTNEPSLRLLASINYKAKKHS